MGAVRLKAGDMALISLPPNEQALADSALWHFEGQESSITRVRTVYGHGSIRGTYYELAGVHSKYGVPYGLLGDWLIKVKE